MIVIVLNCLSNFLVRVAKKTRILELDSLGKKYWKNIEF